MHALFFSANQSSLRYCQSREQIEASACAINFLALTPRRLHSQVGSQSKFTWINYQSTEEIETNARADITEASVLTFLSNNQN